MTTLTIRMDPAEKQALRAWAASRGLTTTDYIKSLVSKDMAKGNAETRAAAWFHENRTALDHEAQHIAHKGVPGAALALNHPWPDAEV